MEITTTLRHVFVPWHTNNFRPRLLHNASLLALAVFLVFFQTLVSYFSSPTLNVLGYASNIPPLEVVEQTNQKRLENGIHALNYSEDLSHAARMKAEDMLEDDYWAHVAPDGTEPWSFFKIAGYSYRYAGENLARDFSDTSSAIEAWLMSPSHRENMLSGKYTEIGVAVVEGDLAGKDTTLIVQLFGTPSSSPSIPVASAQTQTPQPPQAKAVPQSEVVTETQVNSDIAANPQVAVIGDREEVFSPLYLASDFNLMRTAAIAVVMIVMIALVADIIVVSRKGVVRIGSKTFAHLSFMAMVFIILLVSKVGQII